MSHVFNQEPIMEDYRGRMDGDYGQEVEYDEPVYEYYIQPQVKKKSSYMHPT